MDLTETIEAFGTGGVLHRAADWGYSTVEYLDPYQNPQLVKLAAEGNVAADLVLTMHANDDDKSIDWDQLESWKQSEDMVALGMYSVSRATAALDKTATEQYGPEGRPYSKLLHQAGVAAQFWPGRVLGIPNRPGPLSSMLTLGALGAAGGGLYANVTGRIAGTDNRKRRTRRGILAGALAGTLPGLAYMFANYAAGRPMNDPDGVFNLPDLPGVKHSAWYPQAPGSGIIPVQQVQQMVWNDPQVAPRLHPSLVAATSSLVTAASQQRGGSAFVTPHDIGRVAVGMGSGYVGGVIAGKALGAIFGLPLSAQKQIRDAGVTAGMVKAFIPMAFGR